MRSRVHAEGADLERLLAWGQARHPTRVLDVATGGGHTGLAFAPITREVIALDVTEPMLQAARDFVRSRGAGSIAMVAGKGAPLRTTIPRPARSSPRSSGDAIRRTCAPIERWSGRRSYAGPD